MLSFSQYVVSASLLLVLSVLVFRGIVRRDYLRHGRLSLFSAFLETALFFLWGIFTWFDLPAHWPSPQVGTVLRAVAYILIAVGLGCMFATIAAFGIPRAFGRKTDALVQYGPYARSRNPQIVFCALAVVGYAMLWPSWHTAGWVVLYAAMSHMMVITEEEHLRNQHSDEYKRYCERVPRYLPISWSFHGASG